MRLSKSATELYSGIKDIEFMDYSEYKRLKATDDDNISPTVLSKLKIMWISLKSWVMEKYYHHKGVIIVTLSIAIGSVFYALSNNWDTSTSIFYAANALLGILYMVR